MSVPLALAVIPAQARSDLATSVAPASGVTVLQHGWDHVNRAQQSEKKAELAPGRPWRQVMADLKRGRGLLRTMFPETFIPVLVPPWNRIDPDLVSRLSAAGFVALSSFKARVKALGAPGLAQVNCHVDAVDWHGGRGFAGEDRVLEDAVAHLRARRLGAADAGEPTGLLTHHAVHDEASWRFLHRFVARVTGHGAAAWIGIDDALEACR